MTHNRQRRIGLIVPASNTTMEPEFAHYAPQGVSVHTTRLRLEEVNEAELGGMAAGVEGAAMLLADAGVEIIAYGCTTGSLFKGRGHERELEERIEKAVGIPHSRSSPPCPKGWESQLLPAIKQPCSAHCGR